MTLKEFIAELVDDTAIVLTSRNDVHALHVALNNNEDFLLIKKMEKGKQKGILIIASSLLARVKLGEVKIKFEGEE